MRSYVYVYVSVNRNCCGGIGDLSQGCRVCMVWGCARKIVQCVSFLYGNSLLHIGAFSPYVISFHCGEYTSCTLHR